MPRCPTRRYRQTYALATSKSLVASEHRDCCYAHETAPEYVQAPLVLPSGEDQEPLWPNGPEEHLQDCDGPRCQTIKGATEIEDHAGMDTRTNSAQGKIAELH